MMMMMMFVSVGSCMESWIFKQSIFIWREKEVESSFTALYEEDLVCKYHLQFSSISISEFIVKA